MDVLNDTIQTAGKSYRCDACHVFLQSNYGQNDVGAADWLIVQEAEAAKWKIHPGDKYRKITYREDGGFVTYRGRIEMDKLCARHELFDE